MEKRLVRVVSQHPIERQKWNQFWNQSPWKHGTNEVWRQENFNGIIGRDDRI